MITHIILWASAVHTFSAHICWHAKYTIVDCFKCAYLCAFKINETIFILSYAVDYLTFQTEYNRFLSYVWFCVWRGKKKRPLHPHYAPSLFLFVSFIGFAPSLPFFRPFPLFAVYRCPGFFQFDKLSRHLSLCSRLCLCTFTKAFLIPHRSAEINCWNTLSARYSYNFKGLMFITLFSTLGPHHCKDWLWTLDI